MELIADADLSDWAPLTDPGKLQIKWHVPSDEETKVAIELVEAEVSRTLKSLLAIWDEENWFKPNWTDILRKHLKSLVSTMLAAAPLYHRIPPPEEWHVEPDEFPPKSPIVAMRFLGEGGARGSFMIEDYEDEEEEEDDDDDDGSGDAAAAVVHKYVDGYIDRPLSPDDTTRLESIYKQIGCELRHIYDMLERVRADDMQAMLELSTVQEFQVSN